MNAFFWSRRKPSKELVLKVDALLTRLFPDENFEEALEPKSSVNRESGEAVVAPVVATGKGAQKKKTRARVDSADANDNDGEDTHPVSAGPDEEVCEMSGDEASASAKSIPEELELHWSKIRAIFQAWEEEQVERERKMDRMAELLLRYRVLEKTLLPKVLSAMTFETRKYVGHVFRALTVHGFQGFIEYIADHPEIMRWLVDGYKNNNTALICGSMLRDCLEHEILTVIFLKDMHYEFEALFKVTKTNANFDISADAFRNINKVLMSHKTATLGCLSESSDRIFELINSLLQSDNYVTKREGLQLLGELLLDPVNFSVMQKYVASRNNLKIIMMLLRETSQALRMEAYNVFKIFVANPNKSPEVEQLLVRNKEKLLAFVVDFGKNEPSREFHQEKSLVVYSLQRMTERAKAPGSQGKTTTATPPSSSSSTSSSATSPASPASTIQLRKSMSEVCAQQD